jgi:uncharacterized protein YdaU (DUF1376 family)
MAKDPRFNFYPDNWSGGTKRMTFEQKGAYMELLLLNFYCLSDGLPGFTEQEAAKALAHAAAYTELWNFLMPKFKTDGQFYWSERMVKEFHKSKKSSLEQSKRASKRWEQQRDMPRHIPVNGNGIGNGIDNDKERVQGEETDFSDFEKWTADIVSGNDWLFHDKVKNMAIKVNGRLQEFATSHLALLAKYPKMKPPDQNRFRISLIGHIQEKLKLESNGNRSTTPRTSQQISSQVGGTDYDNQRW